MTDVDLEREKSEGSDGFGGTPRTGWGEVWPLVALFAVVGALLIMFALRH